MHEWCSSLKSSLNSFFLLALSLSLLFPPSPQGLLCIFVCLVFPLLACLSCLPCCEVTLFLSKNYFYSYKNATEFDFEKDKYDIRIPEDLDETAGKKGYKKQERMDQIAPESDYSLRVCIQLSLQKWGSHQVMAILAGLCYPPAFGLRMKVSQTWVNWLAFILVPWLVDLLRNLVLIAKSFALTVLIVLPLLLRLFELVIQESVYFKNAILAGLWWLTLVILPTWETEIVVLVVWSQPRAKRAAHGMA